MISKLPKRLVMLRKDNNLVVTIYKPDPENNGYGEYILDSIPEGINTYELIGQLFEAIGKLDKTKPITVFFNLTTLPFAFILLLLKIRITANVPIVARVKDKDTIAFLDTFFKSDPTQVKNFFGKVDPKKPDFIKKVAEEDSECEVNLKNKFSDLVQEVNENIEKNTEYKKLRTYLDETEDSEINKGIVKKNEELFRELEILQNIKNNSGGSENFEDLLENNLIPELKKLDIRLF